MDRSRLCRDRVGVRKNAIIAALVMVAAWPGLACSEEEGGAVTDEEVQAIISRLNAAEAALEDQDGRLTAIEQQVDGLATSITSLQTTVDGHTASIASLDTSVADNTAAIATLETSVTDNSAAIATLE